MRLQEDHMVAIRRMTSKGRPLVGRTKDNNVDPTMMMLMELRRELEMLKSKSTEEMDALKVENDRLKLKLKKKNSPA